MFEEQLGETGGTIAQFGLSLIVVVALIFLVAWVIKRFGGARFGAHHGDQAELQVVDTLAIDTKRKLVLVRHGKLEHLLLIGGNSDEVIERSMVGGIPLAARVQASKAQDKQEEETYSRPADRFRTSNRFSSALLRSKAGEDSQERAATPTGSASTTATAAAGVAAGAIGAAATVAASPKEQTASKAKAQEPAPKPHVSSTDSRASAPPDVNPPTQSEREALDRSLDEALSASLLDEPPSAPKAQAIPTVTAKPAEPTKPDPLKLDSLKTEPNTAPTTASAANVPPVSPVSNEPQASPEPIDDLDLERELEAALELDAFEASPADSDTSAPVDLPPLPDMPDLPDLSTLTDNGDNKDADSPTTSTGAAPLPDAQTETISDTPEVAAPVDPLKLSSVQSTPTDTSPPPSDSALEEPTKTAPETSPDSQPAPDIPVALSGRDDPPIPVTIPSRGPAANATTLAKADESEAKNDAQGEAVDISSMLQPANAGPSTPNETNKPSDDLDDEMARLLGEIAGEPETK